MKEKIIEILKSKSIELANTWVSSNVLLEDDFEKAAKEIEDLYSLEYTKNISTLEDSINGIERYKRFKKRIIIEDEINKK